MNEFEGTELGSIIDAIKEMAELDEDTLTDDVMTLVQAQFKQSFSPAMINQSVTQLINGFEQQGLTKQEVINSANTLKNVLNESIYTDEPYTGNKKILIDGIMDSMLKVIDTAVEKYHSYNIVLPLTLNIGAQVPSYAHETDAAADIYAKEDQTIPAHSYSNMIKTGVKIQLPEGWLAFILPRSSIGLKTPLRLSNSVGLIDSGYRGELGVIYDNTSDEDYQIHAGDRIAQLLVMPSYRFQAKVVDILVDSDRGEGGFGSTDK